MVRVVRVNCVEVNQIVVESCKVLAVAVGDGVGRRQRIGLELNPVDEPLLILIVLLVLRRDALHHLVKGDFNDALVPPAILAEVDVLPWVEYATIHVVVRIEEVLLDLLLGVLRLLTGACRRCARLAGRGRLRRDHGIVDALRRLGHLLVLVGVGRAVSGVVPREDLVIGGADRGDVGLFLGRPFEVSSQLVDPGGRVPRDPVELAAGQEGWLHSA